MLSRLYAKLFSPNSLGLAAILLLMAATLVAKQPTLASWLWPSTDQRQLQTWEKDVRQRGLDAAAWWEFRDTYSPGYFNYNPDTLTAYSILQFVDLPDDRNLLLTFVSPRLVSDEWLMRTNHVSLHRGEWLASWQAKRLAAGAEPNWQILADTPSSLVVATADGQYFGVWMERSLAEMKLVNGLINYDDPDRLLERNWHWVVTGEGVAAPGELELAQVSSVSGQLLAGRE